ncbi:hypothetical protein [Coraliomargarita parva]|uniref:hypothetical protein n=1 Tax=Coraliomargarita parva TaxID=3014050 RepID=UPI0022B4C0BE|nr:hypothetical protein [Coraliomargarita parva]
MPQVPRKHLPERSHCAGFALVVALGLMALILLILLSLSTVVSVETSVATSSMNLQKAKTNALLGMNIALGELQRTAGPDQRVTASATAAYPDVQVKQQLYKDNADDRYGFKTLLSDSGRVQFRSDLNDWWDGKNPRWIGVWESALTDGLPDRDQDPVWLVSGEVTPDTVLADPDVDDDVVWVVGAGSATNASASTDGLDGRVKVSREAITSTDSESGHYAYWVGDESLKANISKTDPFAEETSITSEEYRNRLLAPQDTAWEFTSKFKEFYDGSTDSLSPSDPRLEVLASEGQLSLLDERFSDASRASFHDFTIASQGLLVDVARGGLQKDLTAYFENGSGLNDDDPIPDPANYNTDVRMGADNVGFPHSDNNIPTWGKLRDWYDSNLVDENSSIAVSEDHSPIVGYFRMFAGFSYEGNQVKLHLLPTLVLWNPFDAKLSSADYELRVTYPMGFEYFRVGSKLPDGSSFTDPNGVILNEGSATYFVHSMTPSADLSTDGILYSKMSDKEKKPSDSTFQAFAPWKGTTELVFKFSASFEPGENLVFSVDEFVEAARVSGSPNRIEIPLKNELLALQPASATLPLYTLDTPPPAEAEEVRVLVDTRVGLYSGFYAMDLRLSSGEELFQADQYGDFERELVMSNVRYGEGGLKDSSNGWEDTPSKWRSLYASNMSTGGDFCLEIQGFNSGDGTNVQTSPIFCLGQAYIAPGTPKKEGDAITESSNHRDTLSQYYRAFATHNLSVKHLNAHPLVDDVRGGGFANADGFAVFAYSRGDANIDLPPDNPGLPWDANLANYDLGYARGSSLMNYFFPFAYDSEYAGAPSLPLRTIRRSDSKLLSLGQLQAANVADYAWQPAFVIGNSEASPYVDREAMAGINAREVGMKYAGNFHKVPNDGDNTMVDLSYLLNDALWDSYFLSGAPRSKSELESIQKGDSDMPNSRMVIRNDLEDVNELLDFDTASRWLMNRGALNVNSSSVEAWVALLTSFRDLKVEGGSEQNPAETVPVFRLLEPLGSPVDFTFDESMNDISDYGAVTDSRDYYKIAAGFRYMTDDMIRSLAERISDEVLMRGPFFSLSDFVNRRLVEPDYNGDYWLDARSEADKQYYFGYIDSAYDALEGLSGLNGTLQRAINVSGINGGVNYPSGLTNANIDRAMNVWPVEVDRSEYNNPTGSEDTYRFNVDPAAKNYLDMEHIAGAPAGEFGQLLSHMPGFITQADLLSEIGAALTARGDTFKIRSYGDVVDPINGKIVSQVWLETIVQRVPEPVLDADQDYEPDDAFGRRFTIVSMRWLNEDEI